MVSTPNICPVCKKKHTPKDIKKCPLVAKMTLPKTKKLSDEFFGPSTSIFVGHVGYPKVNVGPMGIVEEDAFLKPEDWFGSDYATLLSNRASLIRSKQKREVHVKTEERFISENQEIVLAKKPTDVELKFRKKPKYEFKFSNINSPLGPSADIKKFKLAENPSISRKVEYIATDELKANESAQKFYDLGLDIYKITNVLSSGALGLNKNKKLVPTRWSITAVDDILSKYIIEKLKDYQSINNFKVFESEYLGNHFVILLMPGRWEFENFEAWAPGSYWSFHLKESEILQEYEPFEGRTKYADKQTGGYYASRLGVVEGLDEMKRQARVVSFREVSEGYTIPVGVWQVRENVRNAFKQNFSEFNSLESALKYADSKLKLDISDYNGQSRILRQKRLDYY